MPSAMFGDPAMMAVTESTRVRGSSPSVAQSAAFGHHDQHHAATWSDGLTRRRSVAAVDQRSQHDAAGSSREDAQTGASMSHQETARVDDDAPGWRPPVVVKRFSTVGQSPTVPRPPSGSRADYDARSAVALAATASSVALPSTPSRPLPPTRPSTAATHPTSGFTLSNEAATPHRRPGSSRHRLLGTHAPSELLPLPVTLMEPAAVGSP
jgi:hypothetical protein